MGRSGRGGGGGGGHSGGFSGGGRSSGGFSGGFSGGRSGRSFGGGFRSGSSRSYHYSRGPVFIGTSRSYGRRYYGGGCGTGCGTVIAVIVVMMVALMVFFPIVGVSLGSGESDITPLSLIHIFPFDPAKSAAGSLFIIKVL